MFLEMLRKSWDSFIKNLTPLAAGSLIIMIFLAASLSLSISLMLKDPMALLSESYISAYAFNSPEMVAAGIFVLLLTVLFSLVLQAGYYGMASESLSRKTGLKTMAKTMRTRWKTVIGAFSVIVIIYLAALFIGFTITGVFLVQASSNAALLSVILVVVAAFCLSVFFSFVFPAIISGKNAIDSLKASFHTARSNYAGAVALVLFFAVLSFVLRSVLEIIPVAGQVLGTALVFLLIMPWETVAFSWFFKTLYKKSRK
jgi:hypothetical protein